MRAKVFEQQGVVVLILRAVVMEKEEAAQLHGKLRELVKNNTKRVILDLSEVDGMNSTGLGILIAGLTTMRGFGGELKLANVGPKLEPLFEPLVHPCFGNRLVYKTVEKTAKSFK